MSRCELFLESCNDYYAPGETISGHLMVTLSEKKQIKRISIKFKGEAETFWNKRSGNRSTILSSYQQVFRKEINLFSSDPKNLINFFANICNICVNMYPGLDALPHGKSSSVPGGVHVYPFDITLPQYLPSSFIGSLGSIKYTIKGEVIRKFLKSTYVSSATVDVLSTVDFARYYLSTRDPVYLRECKPFKNCKFKTGYVSFDIGMPATGFAVGERIPILLNVTNCTHSSISEIRLQIREETEFRATSPRLSTRSRFKIVTQMKLCGVGPHGKVSFEELIGIPRKFIALSLFGCEIIRNKYSIVVDAVLRNPRNNMKVRIPIKIGHLAEEQPLGQRSQVSRLGQTFEELESPPKCSGRVVVIN